MRVKKVIALLNVFLSLSCSAQDSDVPCWVDGVSGNFNTSFFVLVRSFFLGMNFDDVEGDVLRHVEVGDHRFIGARGFSLYFPSMKSREGTEFICKYGWRVLSGTGDAYKNYEEAEYGRKLVQYAQDYNSFLFKEIKKE